MADAPRDAGRKPAPPQRPPRRSLLDRSLAAVERIGNALPHPGSLFALLAGLVVVGSAIAAQVDLAVVHPGTGETVAPVNLLTVAGLHRMILQAVTNFTSFAPLGTVLVAMIGIGVAEGSGLIGAGLRLLVLSAPRRLLTPIVVFAGVMSNTAGEVGYVLLVPLAALLFRAAGRHPVAGLAAAFAGVSGGYSANLLLGTIDPLLAGLTQEAAHIVDPGYSVNPACNYYFLAVSTFLITFLGTFVTERVVVPRLGAFGGGEAGADERIEPLSAAERRGLWIAGAVLALFVAVLLAGLLLAGGFLREIGTGSLLHSPLLKGIVTFIFLGGVVAGIAYGVGAGTIRNDADVMKGMGKALETMGSYLVLVFFAAQFVAYFNWSNLGLILAVDGAELLQRAGLHEIPLFFAFIALSALLNLVMGSASAKWAIMAPVFVPMFMLLGYAPELTQAAYRVGDSVTNILSPMMTYFALIIAFVQRWDPKAGMGTLIATMLPYSVAFFVGWALLFSAWILLDLPLGPGAALHLPVPGR
ncbi:MAG: AbgT family transporter [Thermoanaerobaculia bacterium]|nr:AbgT family transporter [Thermoanaerobaculia bacterium]